MNRYLKEEESSKKKNRKSPLFIRLFLRISSALTCMYCTVHTYAALFYNKIILAEDAPSAD